MARYSQKSLDRLARVDPRLTNVFLRVVEVYDNTIITGHRPEQDQNLAFAKKISKVKWPNSKHNTLPSTAIDAAPYPIPENWGENHWKDMVHFYEFAAIVKYEAAKEGLEIRWGGNWDGDRDYKDNTFDDLLHFEIVGEL